MTKEQAIMYLKTMQGICSPCDMMAKEAVRMAVEALQNEVVRCKDCKYLYMDNGCPLRTWHTHVLDDYCSYGERKGGDTE